VYSEDELLLLSGLQHLVFCPRQWALIHIEQQWQENRYTAEGRILHERADSGGHEKRGDTLTVRSLRLQSLRLGLSGIADVVEFHRVNSEGCPLPHHSGLWHPYPVEYKRGRNKRDDCDEVQLCAQALCLEEMLQVTISEGWLYYGQTHRRVKVTFDAALRQRVEALSAQVHQLWQLQQTPAPVADARCNNCSLSDRCLPDGIGRRSARHYLQQILEVDD
jgi:CRISPR-associated exonuclease Cas4